jgi:hypothetical protein
VSALVTIPVHDFRDGGLPAFARSRSQEAHELMEIVLLGLGPAGRVLRPFLPLGDRIAARRLAEMADPYRDEILALPAVIGRAGPVAFSLSYEWGCTTRVFETGGAPRLFRVLDWRFHGLGERIEVVRLAGPAGEWVTATWPGVMGALHGAAPGRFSVALNQAPERQTGFGRPVDWLAAKRRFLRERGMAPPHLLRKVFEQAPDYAAARAMLAETPVAVPVIFTLAGTRPGEACVIERVEGAAAHAEGGPAVAANHFVTPLGDGLRWRPRGEDSHGRHRAACVLAEPPGVDVVDGPVLNRFTRLALMLDATGALSVAGYDGLRRVTAPCHLQAV